MTRRGKIGIGIGLIAAASIIIWLGARIILDAQDTDPKMITSFYDNDPSKITKIEIRSGSDGEIRRITDATDRRRITNILSTATFKRSSEGESSGGWIYDMNIYEGDKIVFNLYSGGKKQIFDDYYDMSGAESDKMISLMEELLDKYDIYKQ